MSIRVGNTYKVVDHGQIYGSYSKFANVHGYPSAVLHEQSGAIKKQNSLVQVILIDNHLQKNDTLAIVRMVSNNDIKFIISTEGLGEIVKDGVPSEAYIVINSGSVYSKYKDFAVSHGHPDAVLGDTYYYHLDNRIVRILVIDNHMSHSNCVLGIVETIDNGDYVKFMIGMEGLKKYDGDINAGIKPDPNAVVFKECFSPLPF